MIRHSRHSALICSLSLIFGSLGLSAEEPKSISGSYMQKSDAPADKEVRFQVGAASLGELKLPGDRQVVLDRSDGGAIKGVVPAALVSSSEDANTVYIQGADASLPGGDAFKPFVIQEDWNHIKPIVTPSSDPYIEGSQSAFRQGLDGESKVCAIATEAKAGPETPMTSRKR